MFVPLFSHLLPKKSEKPPHLPVAPLFPVVPALVPLVPLVPLVAGRRLRLHRRHELRNLRRLQGLHGLRRLVVALLGLFRIQGLQKSEAQDGPRWSNWGKKWWKSDEIWWNMMKSCSSFFWGPLHKDMLLYYDTMMCFAIIVIVDNMDWHHWIIIGIPSQILITRGPTGLPECIRPKWVYDGLQHVIIDFIHGTKGLSPCRRCIAYRMSVCKKQL